jgi:hypothetical protein
MSERIRADVTDGVRRRIRVTVGVAIETRDALMCLQAPAIFRQVELLLGEGRHEEAQPLELLGIENLFEQALEIVERNELSL